MLPTFFSHLENSLIYQIFLTIGDALICTSLRACLECEIFFPFLRFSCEIELIPVKFLWDSCEIPTFQTAPESPSYI